MKRADLIRRIVAVGARFEREGGSHTIYKSAISGRAVPVPRHNEIKDTLARKIIRDAAR